MVTQKLDLDAKELQELRLIAVKRNTTVPVLAAFELRKLLGRERRKEQRAV